MGSSRVAGVGPELLVVLLVGAFAAFGLVACDSLDPRRRNLPPEPLEPQEPAPSRTNIADRLGLADAMAPVEEPPPPAGDLKDDVEAFASLDLCVAQRSARLDPVLADAVLAFGYDSLVRDACRMLEALRTGRREACEPIGASAVRRRCQTLFAATRGEPDVCPWVDPERASDGHDPTCVALATGDARLCASVERSGRSSCEALVARDASRCARLPRGAAECRRELHRMARMGTPSAAPGKVPPLPEPSAQITLEKRADAGPTAPVHPSAALLETLGRGVVLEQHPDGFHVSIGGGRVPSLSLDPREASLELDLAVGRAAPASPVVVLRGLVGTGGATRFPCPGLACTFHGEVTEGAPERGAPLRLRLQGTVGGREARTPVDVTLQTFVRDIVRAPPVSRR